MRRWFLSYNSQDAELARRLKVEITRKDAKAEIFLAPESLRPGAYWMPALAKEINDSTAFILLVTKNGLGPWQALEYQEAVDRSRKEPDFAVVPLVLDGVPAPGLPFLRQLHWIVTADPASENSIAQLFDATAGAGTFSGELWRHTAPYRGLSAMTETDADYFFGRERETADVIGGLAATAEKIPLLLGNSGVGKSSLARAGVVAAFMRQDWPESAAGSSPWPQVFTGSRRWCFLTLKPGVEPLRALVDPFLWTWQFDATDPDRAVLQSKWARGLLDGNLRLRDLLDATQARYRDELHQPEPPAFLLYIDQGEELYVRQAAEGERRRFSEILADALADPRLRVMMSLRSDFFGELQKDEALYSAHRQINVPPLREAQLRNVVSKPADMLSARFETPQLVDIITRRTVEDSLADVGALPLLSYTLDDMWKQMAERGDAILRLPAQSFDLGGVLVDRANTFLATHPGAEAALRRILTLRLATVRDEGEPTRRRAPRSEFSQQEWPLVCELADYPNRLLVTATSDAGDTYAEVAHEAIFRRWDKLKQWIDAEREFLAWRGGLEAARRVWAATADAAKQQALLMGAALTQAQSWFAKRADDLPAPDREFIAQSNARERKARARARFVGASICGMVAVVLLGLVGWINQDYLTGQWRFWMVTRPYAKAQFWPYVLSAAQEHALKPGDSFKECAVDCPEMVVVPAGSFTMGGPKIDEQPQRVVTIAKPFAVSKYELTFADWDACVVGGGCSGYKPNDRGFGRGQQPVINVNWDDAQQYVDWLSRMTGKTYRLLSESEYEYAARAGTTTVYPWGDNITRNGAAMADCMGCGGKWEGQPAPVGSFPPNNFGLYDMEGNVTEWTEDCVHKDYHSAPTDGSAWMSGGDCRSRMLRSGGWNGSPSVLPSADRGSASFDFRHAALGFRLARTLGARESPKDQAIAFTTRGDGFSAAGDLDRAIADYDQAIALDPKYAAAYNRRGIAYKRKGDLNRAIADYGQAIALDPKYAAAYDNRGIAYKDKGDLDRAIADFDRAIALNPKYALAYDNRGMAHENNGDLDSAIADYDRAIALNPKYAVAYNNRGSAYKRKGELDRAIADYDRAIALNPKSAITYANRGNAYIGKGDYDRAIADYDRAIALNPKYAAAYDGRGHAYFARGDYGRAIADYDSATRVDPKRVYAYLGRGRVNLYAGALPRAVADMTQATALAPKYAFAALWLDIASKRSGLSGRLAEAAQQIDMTKWPAPVIRLYLGQITLEVLLTTAADNANAETKRGQVCEANFYSAELKLQQGKRDEAAHLFRLAAADCQKDFVEYAGAIAELKALGAQP